MLTNDADHPVDGWVSGTVQCVLGDFERVGPATPATSVHAIAFFRGDVYLATNAGLMHLGDGMWNAVPGTGGGTRLAVFGDALYMSAEGLSVEHHLYRYDGGDSAEPLDDALRVAVGVPASSPLEDASIVATSAELLVFVQAGGSLHLARTTDGRRWIVSERILSASLPTPYVTRSGLVSSDARQVTYSVDGGETWVDSTTELDFVVEGMGARQDTVFVSSAGIWRSSDGGMSFVQVVARGLEPLAGRSWAFCEDTVFATTTQAGDGILVGNITAGSWTHARGPDVNTDVLGLDGDFFYLAGVEPDDAGTSLVAVLYRASIIR